MPNKFLITGLPRTRTAWLSALFSTDKVLCWHEPINKLGSAIAVQNMLDNIKGYAHVGISDSSIAVEADFYINYFFEHPVVIIERPKAEVIESLIRFLGITRKEATKITDSIHEGLRYIKRVRDVMQVDFYSLDDSTVVRNIWEYVTIGLPFDDFRCEQFQNLMINQHGIKIINNINVDDDIKKRKN